LLIVKLKESYFKAHIPMRKHGMVPDCRYPRSDLGWRVGLLPTGFYDKVDQGSVVLRKCGGGGSFGFCADDLVLDDDQRVVVEADLVILATGYDPDAPLRSVLASPWFRNVVAGGRDVLPLYRQCVHQRIPQAAVVGYAESGASVYPYEMMARWVAHLLDGAVRLPARPSRAWSATWRSGRRGGGGRGEAAAGSSSSPASTASPRGTMTSYAETWGTAPGGSPGY
jgi:dimethylaniline monooxygenase (N-oxide forming)